MGSENFVKRSRTDVIGDSRPVAVIDIGSNSVRLVVYSGMIRTPIPLHNEKTICALGKGLERTGRLNPEGVELALDTIERFVALSKALGVERVDAVGTAAVRDATDGEDFAKTVRKRCGIEVQVLTGKQEAERSALGVLCGIPTADGIVADLGGGSLELARVHNGSLDEYTTLPIGLLRLEEASNGEVHKATSIVDRGLGQYGWMAKGKGKTLYVVGGAWRSLARVCIAQMDYPLHVLDNFTLERRHAASLFEVIRRLGSKSLEHIQGVSKGRVASLPLAATVLERLLHFTKPTDLVFSIYGMREGHFFNALPSATQKQDPLISLAEEIGQNAGRDAAVGYDTFNWISPLFSGQEDNSERQRLRLAACLLSNAWWTEHPDYRAEQAFLRVLRLPFLGLDHEDRAGLALALYYRYSTTLSEPLVEQAHALLEKTRVQRVKTVGLALRLAYALSAGGPGVLEKVELSLKTNKLILDVPKGDPLFRTGSYPRRLKKLAEHLNIEAEVHQV